MAQRGWHTEAIERLGIELPIVSAPMGGGPSTPALVAAVSEAGGVGSLGGGGLSPGRLRAGIAARRALAAVEPYRLHLELPPRPTATGPWAEDFDAQVAVLVEERVPVVSFTFGLLPAAAA